jgi:diguanylate cyclase
MGLVFLAAAAVGSVAGIVAAALYGCLFLRRTAAAAPPVPPAPHVIHQPADPNLALIERLQVLMRLVRDNVEEHSASVSDVDQDLRRLQQGGSPVMAEVAAALDALLEKNARLQQRLRAADRELSKQSELLETQRKAASTDPLTGLANRRAFDEELARLAQEATPVGMLMLDLDHFKQVNDEFGHSAGDAVLMETAVLLRKGVRQGAFVARLGGEEFAVLVPHATALVLSRVSQRLRQSIAAASIGYEGHPIRLTTSVGAALHQPAEDLALLCKRADEALYASKRSGRNCGHLHTGTSVERIEVVFLEKPAANAAPLIPLASRIELMAQIRRHFLEADLQANPLTLVLLEIESRDEASLLPIDHAGFRQALALARGLMRAGDLIAESDPNQAAILIAGPSGGESSGPLSRLAAVLREWSVQHTDEVTLKLAISQTKAGDDWVTFVRRAENSLELPVSRAACVATP